MMTSLAVRDGDAIHHFHVSNFVMSQEREVGFYSYANVKYALPALKPSLPYVEFTLHGVSLSEVEFLFRWVKDAQRMLPDAKREVSFLTTEFKVTSPGDADHIPEADLQLHAWSLTGAFLSDLSVEHDMDGCAVASGTLVFDEAAPMTKDAPGLLGKKAADFNAGMAYTPAAGGVAVAPMAIAAETVLTDKARETLKKFGFQIAGE
jgi:hypothetical protein